MCGRYSFILDAVTAEDAIEERYPAATVEWDPESHDRYTGENYNIAPSSENPVVKRESPEKIELQRWGLVPHWADDPDDWGAINARSETVHENNVFRASFAERRCLVPAQGFYEWRYRDEGASEPHRIVPRDAPHDLFLFAGIWSEWTPPTEQTALDGFGDGADGVDGAAEDGAEALRSYAILTTPANDAVAPIHDRMPVTLHGDECRTWLDGDAEAARSLLDDAGLASDALRAYRVSRAVNDVSNDGAELWRPLED